jgi:hypothetical protein
MCIVDNRNRSAKRKKSETLWNVSGDAENTAFIALRRIPVQK